MGGMDRLEIGRSRLLNRDSSLGFSSRDSNFVLEMQQAASTANQTIAVLSEKYLESAFTASEWAAAFAQDPLGKKQKRIPIRIAHSGAPKRDPGVPKRLWIVKRRAQKGASSEGDKKLTRLTKVERAGWTINKAFEAAAEVMTEALAEEKAPSEIGNSTDISKLLEKFYRRGN